MICGCGRWEFVKYLANVVCPVLEELSMEHEHCTNNGHTMEYDKTLILVTTTSFWYSIIHIPENLMNHDSGYLLNNMWNPVISEVCSRRRR